MFNTIRGLFTEPVRQYSDTILIVRVSGIRDNREFFSFLKSQTQKVLGSYADKKNATCFKVQVRNAKAKQVTLALALKEQFPNANVRVHGVLT